jgi:hypothetical protein
VPSKGATGTVSPYCSNCDPWWLLSSAYPEGAIDNVSYYYSSPGSTLVLLSHDVLALLPHQAYSAFLLMQRAAPPFRRKETNARKRKKEKTKNVGATGLHSLIT